MLFDRASNIIRPWQGHMILFYYSVLNSQCTFQWFCLPSYKAQHFLQKIPRTISKIGTSVEAAVNFTVCGSFFKILGIPANCICTQLSAFHFLDLLTLVSSEQCLYPRSFISQYAVHPSLYIVIPGSTCL